MFFIALLAMLCWSGSDLFSKTGTHPTDRFSHFKVGIAVGGVMGLHALYSVTLGGVSLTFSDMVAYLPASVLYILSMVIGYVGLRYIELSISSPICNTSGALALIFSLAYFGVKWVDNDEVDGIYLNAPIIIGVVAIVIGVLALGIVDYHENDEARALRQAASGRKYTKSLLAILLPMIYCLLDAAGTFVDTLLADRYMESDPHRALAAAEAAGKDAELVCGDILNTAYEFTWFAVALVFLVIVAVRMARHHEKPSLRYDGQKLLGGVCETVGQVFYMMVVVSEYKVGLVIISAYCALSFVWSRIFLKEKLSWKHYLALAAVFAGILILGIFDV